MTIDTLPKDTVALIESLKNKVEAGEATKEENEKYWAWIGYLKEISNSRMR